MCWENNTQKSCDTVLLRTKCSQQNFYIILDRDVIGIFTGSTFKYLEFIQITNCKKTFGKNSHFIISPAPNLSDMLSKVFSSKNFG